MTGNQKALIGLGALALLFLLARCGGKVVEALKNNSVDPGPPLEDKDVTVELDDAAAKADAQMPNLVDEKGKVNLAATNPDQVTDYIEQKYAEDVAEAMPVPIEQNVRSVSILTAVTGGYPVPRPYDGDGAADIQQVTPFSETMLSVVADPGYVLE